METNIKKWEFGALNIYDHNKEGSLKYYFDFVKKNHDNIEGDIVECGVFQGKSIISMGLLLKELNSKKTVYGFDSFSGFPVVHYNDDLSKFDDLFRNNNITQQHYDDIQVNKKIRSLTAENLNAQNISNSGDFSNTSKSQIEKKCQYLGLDNVKLIPGSFSDSMLKNQVPKKIFACLIDCDLYESYQISLPFVWKRLVKNGYMFLDEYYSLKFPGARIATDEFFKNLEQKPMRHKDDSSGFERWYVTK